MRARRSARRRSADVHRRARARSRGRPARVRARPAGPRSTCGPSSAITIRSPSTCAPSRHAAARARPSGWRSVPDRRLARPRRRARARRSGEPRRTGRGASCPRAARIELRLAAGRRDVPSLWVIRDGGVAAIDQLLEYLPDEVVARLDVRRDRRRAADRDRARAHRPPGARRISRSRDAEEYAPLAQMPDVYAPAGAIVEPPLRRERLRDDPRRRASRGRVARARRRIPPRFASSGSRTRRSRRCRSGPTTCSTRTRPRSCRGMRATEIDFAPFVSTGLEWASAPTPRAPDDGPDEAQRRREHRAVGAGRRAGAARRRARRAAETADATAPKRRSSRRPRSRSTPSSPRARPSSSRSTRPAMRPSGSRCSSGSARPTRALGRLRDAGLCFARAVWEAAPAERLKPARRVDRRHLATRRPARQRARRRRSRDATPSAR